MTVLNAMAQIFYVSEIFRADEIQDHICFVHWQRQLARTCTMFVCFLWDGKYSESLRCAFPHHTLCISIPQAQPTCWNKQQQFVLKRISQWICWQVSLMQADCRAYSAKFVGPTFAKPSSFFCVNLSHQKRDVMGATRYSCASHSVGGFCHSALWDTDHGVVYC